VVVIDQGKIIETGPKEQVLERPGRHRTAECIGVDNLFPCRVLKKENGEMTVRVASMELVLKEDSRFSPDQTAYIGISPPDARVSIQPSSQPNTVEATIRSSMERKNIMLVHLDILPDGPTLVADLPKHFIPKWGLEKETRVYVSLPKEALFLCQE
jgi:molybdate transport system ATP-binding protein